MRVPRASTAVVDTQGNLRGIVALNDMILHAEKTDRHGEAPVSYAEVMATLEEISKHRIESAMTTAP